MGAIEDFRRFERGVVVPWGDYDVSQYALLSLGFSDCASISLMNGTQAGLSHIDGTRDAMEHLDGMIEKMGVLPKKLRAILVSTADSRDRNLYLEECCSRRGIEIADRYYEGIRGRPMKDILVVPSLRQVQLYVGGEIFREKMVTKRF